MTTEERLFRAIGEADESLLERSEHSRKKRRYLPVRLAAAACLTLALNGYLYLRSPTDTPAPPPDSEVSSDAPGTSDVSDTPVQTLRLSGGEVGTFFLHQLCDDTASEPSGFILYVDEETYRQVTKDGVYTIEPLVDTGNLPACSLEISHQADITLPDAALLAAETLAETYTAVSETQETSAENRLLVTASNGITWDAEQADVYLVDDRQGSVFILVSRYFLEAIEGHGARFADMIGTFEVVTSGETAPAWLSELRAAGERLIPALFAGDLSSVADLLAEDAVMDVSLEKGRSISSIDYTTDSDVNPIRAVISVRNRQLENSYDDLTIELVYEAGHWLAIWAGLEK